MNNDNLSYGLRVEYVEYVVKKGDSIYSIAKNFDSSVSELIDINMLTSNTIYPGQVLLVPKKDVIDVNLNTYVTVNGDTVEKISKKTGVDPVLIGEMNNFAKLELVPSQTLTIPRNNSYIVSKGDTLESILKNRGISASDLLHKNASIWLKEGNQINL